MALPRLSPALVALAAIVIGALANIGLFGLFENSQLGAWIVTIVATIALVGCIGKAINGRWDGVIVNGRNTLSLSKLQMLAWTILVLSALIAAAAHNLRIGDPSKALDIGIDTQLLIVMGISTTSLVAAPAALSLKDGSDGGSAVAVKDQPDDASWLDLFRGDLADTANTPDLSKIQQFLITLVVLSAYAVTIGKVFADFATAKHHLDAFTAFPPIGERLVWLIGISHAGYIAYKAAPQPQPQAQPQPPASGGNHPPADADDGAVG